ncbi:hypothetical protein GYMLUDRAFT_701211 [Collybiopsis luxurians FD-317 M1]|uniref:Uncharacterized protein n=1 Tax=Collybiopsis luxurians FD-317 M1 TaxID=944289 RepID=A0A0D0C6V8_9AGAR|nr:hypothetical protein GYMLUDRAFT_701211 [Collybiopsis luxurians FD-317 M1]
MAKTPKKPNAQAPGSKRPARSCALVSFTTNDNDSDNIQNDSDEIIDSDEEKREKEVDVGLSLGKFMQEIQKRQAKKNSIMSTAFDNQKKALYADIRKQAKEMSQEGVLHIENLKATLLEPLRERVPFEWYLNQLAPLWKDREASLASLYNIYPTGINDLFLRRSQAMDDASGMLRTNPSRREKALRHFLEDARQELDRSRQNEINAADASKLIKHYKALLLDH